MKMILGTHRPTWLTMAGPPLMVSARTLPRRLPRAACDWVLDSGGFTELSMYGSWDRVPAHRYAAKVRRIHDEVGRMEWAAPQDWMCEPVMLARTGLTVAEHQRRTVDNFINLRTWAPDLPIIPVLQGWTLDDYLRCADQYVARGVDLTTEPTVGVGSVCRRQATREAAMILGELAGLGLRLHGFGLKQAAVAAAWPYLVSVDSMAWSLNARLEAQKGRPSCDPSRRKSCGNCRHYAIAWWERTCTRISPLQLSLC